MKNILESKFMKEMISAASNMYRLGWDERNGGNISYLLKDYDLSEYLDLNGVIREIPMGFEAKSLVGQCFLVTGTGKYFKNVESDPENNLGIVRMLAGVRRNGIKASAATDIALRNALSPSYLPILDSASSSAMHRTSAQILPLR